MNFLKKNKHYQLILTMLSFTTESSEPNEGYIQQEEMGC